MFWAPTEDCNNHCYASLTILLAAIIMITIIMLYLLHSKCHQFINTYNQVVTYSHRLWLSLNNNMNNIHSILILNTKKSGNTENMMHSILPICS